MTMGNSTHSAHIPGSLSGFLRAILPVSLIGILLLLISLPIVLGLIIIS
jgi:hypothetical protein